MTNFKTILEKYQFKKNTIFFCKKKSDRPNMEGGFLFPFYRGRMGGCANYRGRAQPAGGSSPGWARCLAARHPPAGELVPAGISELGRDPWLLWPSAKRRSRPRWPWPFETTAWSLAETSRSQGRD